MKEVQRKYKGNTKEVQREYKGSIEEYKGNIKELRKKYKENTKMVGDNKASKVILIPLKEILIYDEEVAKDN